jgi:hypothetical protein
MREEGAFDGAERLTDQLQVRMAEDISQRSAQEVDQGLIATHHETVLVKQTHRVTKGLERGLPLLGRRLRGLFSPLKI